MLLYGVAALLLKACKLPLSRVPMPVTIRHALAESVSARKPGEICLNGARRGRDVHADGVSDSAIGACRDSAQRSAWNGERVLHRHHRRNSGSRCSTWSRPRPGTEGKPEALSAVSARIVAINGTPIEQMKLARLRTALPDGPHDLHLRDDAARHRGPPRRRGGKTLSPADIRIGRSFARRSEVEPGAEITWNAFGKIIRRVLLRSTERIISGFTRWSSSITNPGTLESLPTVYYGAARVQQLRRSPPCSAPLMSVSRQ